MIKEERPWGWYEILLTESEMQIKRIHVYAGKRLSLQSHEKRSEHWFITAGIARVQVDEQYFDFTEGNSITILQGEKHRVQAVGDNDVEFIEIQRGTYFGEDDIVRYEDDFGRA